MMELQEILEGIRTGTLNYGEDKEYYLLTDEDGEIMLLHKTDPSIKGWSKYDNEVVWSACTYENRGLDITEYFLSALNIDYMG